MTSQARGKIEPVEAPTSTPQPTSKASPNADTDVDAEADTPTDAHSRPRDRDRDRDDERRKRQQTSSDNIDELLGSGKSGGRREDQSPTVVAGMGSSSEEPPRRGGSLHSHLRDRDRDTESSADEGTNMIRGPRSSGNSGLNYQGTTTTTTNPLTKKASARRQQQQQQVEGNEEDEAAKHQGWWARKLSKYGSIELENKGSVARDHLALERTFLAWLRTSLAFASIGIAITQLFRLNVTSAPSTSHPDQYGRLRSMGKPLGATFLGISIVMLFIGFHRYFESQHWIIRGKFPASRGSIVIVALVTFALMVTSLVVVVVVEPGSTEK